MVYGLENSTLARREFLKFGGAALAGFLLLPLPPRDQGAREQGHLGRIAERSVWSHKEPDHRAPAVRRYRHDDVITYFGEVEARGSNPHNPIWLRTADGYVYSSYVQPVEVRLNTPLQHIPAEGLWGEISVPYTDARRAPAPNARRTYRLYYNAVFRVAEAVWGTDYRLWYRLYDAQAPRARHYVPAEHVCPIWPEDLTPLSPTVYDKRIEISLADQLLMAFENGEMIFTTRISSGTGGERATPRGKHHIVFKSPSRHMRGDDYDLPGVPFDCYFWGSVAIHGAYWHNDFGRPRSHGCVNLPPAAARWIFRWTVPLFPYHRIGIRVREGGTPVIVY